MWNKQKLMISRNPKVKLILAMLVIVLIAVAIASVYYSNQNKSVDPRIVEARALYSKYDEYAQNNNFTSIFDLLDSIEDIYRTIPYYENSFEIGVVQNNRAAAYLSMAIYFESNSFSLDGIQTLSKDSLIKLGEESVINSIKTYRNWIKKYGEVNEAELIATFDELFFLGLESFSLKEKEKFKARRIDEIIEAQVETPRRLSVALTNLGIVKRHQEKYEEAVKCYTQAIDAWDKNLAAENNLNKLMGKPLKKLNIFQKLFPPEKVK